MPGASFFPTSLADLWQDVSLSGVAQGDLLVRGASKWNNLAAGTSGYFLKSNGPGANPSWAAVSVSPGGSSGQLQYNNSGAFGGLASTAVATSGNLITVTAPAATDVPFTLVGDASQTANLLVLKKGSTTVGYFLKGGGLYVNQPSGDSNNLLSLNLNSASRFTVDSGGNTTLNGRILAQNINAGNSVFCRLQAGDNLNSYTGSIYPLLVNSADSTTAAMIRIARSSTTTVERPQCDIHTDWIVNTDATRTSRVRFSTYYTSTLQEGLRIDSSATQARLAVGGNTNANIRLLVYSGQPSDVSLALQQAVGTPSADFFQCLQSDGTTVIYKVNKDGNPTAKSTYFFEDANGYISRTSLVNTMSFSASSATDHMKLSANYLDVLVSTALRLKAAIDTTDGVVCAANKGGNSGTGLGLLLHGGDGSTSGTPTAGGYAKLYGGGGAAGNTNGGAVYVFGGAKFGSGLDGDTILGYTGSAARGNLSLFGAGSFGSGVGVVFIANATTVPTSDPTGGGILYCEGGALKYRGSSGTITTLGAA